MATYNIGPGQTYETFTALVAAVTLAAGDAVDGGDNTFTETWTVNRPGSSGNHIVLQNAVIDAEFTRDYCINAGGYDYLTLQNITMQHANSAGLVSAGADFLYVFTNLFKDNWRHWYIRDGQDVVLKWNIHKGCTDNVTPYYIADLRDCGDTVGQAAIVQHNIFAPSENNLSGTIRLWGNGAADRYIYFVGNYFSGAKERGIEIYADANPVHAVISNNIGLGHGAWNFDGTQTIYDRSDEGGGNNLLLNFKEGYNYHTDAGLAALTKLPVIESYSRNGLFALTFDDNEMSTAGNTAGILSLLANYPTLTASWCIYPGESLTAGVKTDMETWLNAGHDISLHGYTHDQLNQTNICAIASNGNNITAAINRPDATDFTTWTGTVQIAGEAAINITHTTTLSGLHTMLTAQNALYAVTTEANISASSPAVQMEAGTYSDGEDIPFHDEARVHVQISEGKKALESAVRNLSGYESWECKTFANPYIYTSDTAMDEYKTAGFIGARGGLNVKTGHLFEESFKGYIYNLSSVGTPLLRTGGVMTEERIAGIMTRTIETGGAIGIYLHAGAANKPTDDELNLLFAALTTTSNVINGSLDDIVEYIRSNGTMTEGDGTGKNEQWHLEFTDLLDVRFERSSPCVRAGAVIEDVNDGGEEDPWGNATGDNPNIGADQAMSDEVDFAGRFDTDTQMTIASTVSSVKIKKVPSW